MNPIDILAALPQFIRTEEPHTVYNMLSNCTLTQRVEAEGLVLRSGALIVTLEEESLQKYLSTAELQARLLRTVAPDGF